MTVPCLRPVGIAKVVPNSATHRLGARVGRQIEVGGRAAEQHVAHAAAHQVRLMAGVAQPPAERQHVGGDLGAQGLQRRGRACSRLALLHVGLEVGAGARSRSSVSSASAAALCSASFFERPLARAHSRPANDSATSNRLS